MQAFFTRAIIARCWMNEDINAHKSQKAKAKQFLGPAAGEVKPSECFLGNQSVSICFVLRDVILLYLRSLICFITSSFTHY